MSDEGYPQLLVGLGLTPLSFPAPAAAPWGMESVHPARCQSRQSRNGGASCPPLNPSCPPSGELVSELPGPGWTEQCDEGGCRDNNPLPDSSLSSLLSIPLPFLLLLISFQLSHVYVYVSTNGRQKLLKFAPQSISKSFKTQSRASTKNE